MEDNKAKVVAFMKEYKELTEKHKIDFATFPVWQPSGDGIFQCVIQSVPVSTEMMGIKSSFVNES